MGKKTHSASKPSTPRNRVRGVIGDKENAGPLIDALSRVKLDAPVEEFAELLQLAFLSPQFVSAVPAARLFTDHAALVSVTPLTATTPDRELLWAAATLEHASDALASFVPLRESYFRLLMQGNYADAHKKLDEIDSKCGLSTWTVENRIALLETSDGFEVQKAYVGKFSKEKRRSFVSFFATSVSERNESRVSRRGFEARLRERATTWKIESDQLDYIFYKLLAFIQWAPTEIANILAFEATGSAIDLYETILTLLIGGAHKKLFEVSAVLNVLHSFQSIHDLRTSKLLLLYQAQKGPVPDLPGLQEMPKLDFLVQFLRGNYVQSLAATNAALMARPDDHAPLVLRAKLLALGFAEAAETKSLPDQIVFHLANVFDRNVKTTESIEQLDKLQLNFRHAPFADALVAPIKLRSTGGNGTRSHVSISYCISSPYWHPRIAIALAEHMSHAQLLSRVGKNEIEVWDYERLLVGSRPKGDINQLTLSFDSFVYAQLNGALQVGDYDGAIRLAESLQRSKFRFFQIEAQLFHALALYKSGRIDGSLRASVDFSVAHEGDLHSLPIIEIIRERRFIDFKHMRAELILPIAFYLFGKRAEDSAKDVSLKVSWKKFLEAHGVAKPSDLTNDKAGFKSDQFCFFLREVCTQQVMELSGEFTSPIELDQERIRICQKLTELDPLNREQYELEIRDLTRRVRIEEGVTLLESSRLYVDEVGLRRWAADQLSEQFLRYKDHIRAGLVESIESLEVKFEAMISKSPSQRELHNFLDSYEVSADSLLEEIIERTGKAFLALPRYGLDSYLGSRVRHGSLVGHLRGPLERQHLITKVDKGTGTYKANTFWVERLGNESTVGRKSIERSFQEFSRQVDGLLDDAIARFVHVHSDGRPDGLINFSGGERLDVVLRRWLLLVKLQMGKDTTLDQLVLHCIETLFWPAIPGSLARMQQYVRCTLGPRLTLLVDKLIADLRKVTPTSQMSALDREVITARQELSLAIDKVSNWFQLPKKLESTAAFTLKLGIEIGLQSTRHAYPLFDPQMTWQIEEEANVQMHTQVLGVINDVSFLIFGNIAKHSGFEELAGANSRRPAVLVEAKLALGEVIELKVTSDISDHRDIQEIATRAQAARELIAKGEIDKFAQQSGGTGLLRLAQLLVGGDGRSGFALSFGLTNKNRFNVQVCIPRRHLMVPIDL